ncbi:MAG: DNA polymerase III subunit alpha, partial [Firmicutes bacterium]|nr:DNA polymerase III subunit alpha [Bacillota bacterium]
MSFCHLHTHTEYSLLDGAASVKKLISRVKELGMTSCAITDHGSMYGAAEFYKEAKANGIHPVIGCEVYVAPRSRFDKVHGTDNRISHLILLAENNAGYKNLMQIVSRAYIDGFYYKPRIDMELLSEHGEGLIVTSACLAGEIPKLLLSGDYAGAKKTAQKYIDIVGKDNYFLEIQDHGIAEQKRVIPDIIRLSEELGVGLVATNDIHYLTKSDAKYQDLLMCIQTEKKVNDKDRMRFETEEFYVKSPEEMAELFKYAPEALENTGRIAERCNVELDFGSRHLPSFDVPNGKDAFAYLTELCNDGIKIRYETVTSELQERLDYELGVIKNMGFVDYFLIVNDFIRYARSKNIMVGPGRGSAAGSLVSYCLGITKVDPIKYSLIFERFLNPERVSMPDIDIDFEPERRQEIIDYVVEKYGKEQVAQIITFGTMKAKLAIRDVGRAMDMPYADVDKVAKLIPFDLGMTIEKAMNVNPELKSLYGEDMGVRELLDNSMALEGLPRHASTHAAGVVITSEPIMNYVPVQLNNEGFTVTQFTKDTVEELGLLKMDFLGLRNLTVIVNAVKIIKINKGEDIDLDRLDYGRSEVYELISSGNTDGVFQLENAGMKSFMTELKPFCLEDIIAGIALYRPGPMEQIPRYIHNKNHPEDVTYKHPLLEDILKTTYGCMVYQEQVLEIVRVLAGYSLGKADTLRRVISKKKADKMKVERQNFIYGNEAEGIPGCIKMGIDEQTAMAVFDEINDFANYAFNKSHAAAYAYIAYQTAYLKTFYPVEFMAALISSLGDTDKIPHYIKNCSDMGIAKLPPDINKSREIFTVEGNAIRYGLASIKNVGRAAVAAVVKDRDENGEFKSFADFIDRAYPLGINKKSLEYLIKSGAFDSMGIKRSQLLAVYESALDSGAAEARGNIAGQMSLFDDGGADELEFPKLDELDKRVLLAYEKDAVSMYFSGHPMDEYGDFAKRVSSRDISSITMSVSRDENGMYVPVPGGLKDNESVVICAYISERRNKTTRANSQMAFLKLEDSAGEIECIVFPKVLAKYSSIVQENSIMVIKGRVSFREDEEPKLIAETFTDAAVYAEQTPEIMYIKLKTKDKAALELVSRTLAPYSGNTEVRLFFADTKSVSSVPRRLWINPS